MNIQYPVISLDDSRVQIYQARRKDLDFIEYELTTDDIITFPGYTLETLALRFYGDRKLWTMIYDYNPVVMPDEFEVGMIVKIPVFSSSTSRRSMAYLPRSS